MKKLLILILLLYQIDDGTCQPWIRYYGFGHQPYAYYCIEHYDKGYILAGSINSDRYGWIIKTDINGNELWDLKIGDGFKHTGINNIENTTDHGLILCGSTNLFNYPNTDPYIMKLNSCGEVEWCRVLIYDNTGDLGISVKPAIDGGYILLGEFYGNDPNNRIRMFKFDGNGELSWYKIYNRDSLIYSEILHSLIADSMNFLITADCYYPNWLKPYYIQTDTSGNETWRLVYSQHTGLNYVGMPMNTIRDKYGDYYSVGYRDEFPELLKLSYGGYEMMTRDLILGVQSATAVTIHSQNDTSLIIGASWLSTNSIPYLGLLKTDTMGNIQKTIYFPDPNTSSINWTTKTSDNKILTIGNSFVSGSSRFALYKVNSDLEYDSVYTGNYTYDSLCPHAIVSDTIMPSCIVLGFQEPFEKPETTALKVYPNPARQMITIEFPKYLIVKNGNSGFGSTTVYQKWRSTLLETYDLSGKMFFEKEIIRAQNTLDLDISNWPRGIYYFRLVYNRQTVGEAKVVVR